MTTWAERQILLSVDKNIRPIATSPLYILEVPIDTALTCFPLTMKLAALMQFNHITIRIAHEDALRARPELDGAATQ
jgi:hypothetical protein